MHSSYGETFHIMGVLMAFLNEKGGNCHEWCSVS